MRPPAANALIGRPAWTIRLSHLGMPASRVIDRSHLVHASAEHFGDPGRGTGSDSRPVLSTTPRTRLLAADTAASTSAATPLGTVAITASVSESNTSIVSVPLDGTQRPLM